ncbi:bifunctional 2-polyprenyl-6-hydroxyphenol methylase/3-demethylubiquinol 3-O-methyltransferase UbiG [Paucibacter sp. PLA-PC-4]|uniref:bifunctional 2-polyprenyl-6-hydroxyphenol methylase/3-demethylubiquinol 3-O-methyltransferase UbiG n=1 Tax=Paucibacter sp. PLA-PC-4 TaxID=2993655 RepID=UPI002248A836|nr:bifunctional 2-polyprenyl-6-hydroxyphenol methylase/3-demethylubiquinol 3-O-methyltransferase UbiG [Paucibacter sp. PLA-PC-4]
MTSKHPPMEPATTVRDEEVRRFNRLAATWWNSAGPMRPLHVINALRLDYVLAQISACFGRQAGDLNGLRMADIGCGAGLMCEPLAARGAQVVGVDAAANNIAAARLHAAETGLRIDYRCGEPGATLGENESFDVLLLLEVVEHVDQVPAFVRDAISHLRPGGLLLVSTINRTPSSFLNAIVGAEYVLRILPRGTHSWRQFVRPEELQAIAQDCGLLRQDLRGMSYLPVVHRARWSKRLSVNYIACYRKPGA